MTCWLTHLTLYFFSLLSRSLTLPSFSCYRNIFVWKRQIRVPPVAMASVGVSCPVCGKSALRACGACRQVFYCEKEHQVRISFFLARSLCEFSPINIFQKQHWSHHKKECRKGNPSANKGEESPHSRSGKNILWAEGLLIQEQVP